MRGSGHWAYQSNRSLFIATERAMQVRSFRDNGRIFQAYEVQSPAGLSMDALDENAFAEDVAARLQLTHGCRADAVELPEDAPSPRQIMIAVTAAGPRESSKTFEDDGTIGTVQYRPATELILVYFPNSGRIELCGRRWSDRKIVAEAFARDILHEDLSKRPLLSRTYDLAPLRGPLKFDVPERLADRIISVSVTELRVALGSYDRKVTLTVTPDEDIDGLRKDVFGALRSRYPRGFVCDVEFYLKVTLPDVPEKPLRFRVNNHNSCTLQSNPDADLRAVGFEFLQAIGVVRTTQDADDAEVEDLLPTLLRLLDHPGDEVAGPEALQFGAPFERLTSARFLHKRQIVETMLIEDEEIGELRVDVSADPGRGSADLNLVSGVLERSMDLEEASRWTINRDYILDTVTRRLSALVNETRPLQLCQDLHLLGNAELEGRPVPLFFATRLFEDRIFARVDDAIRSETEFTGGMVLVPGPAMARYLGAHVVVELGPATTDRPVTLNDLHLAWKSRRRRAEAATDVSFERLGATRAELIIPGKAPLTIAGDKQIRIVERLYRAHVAGEKLVASRDLKEVADVTQIGPAFGDDWQKRIRDVYIFQPDKRSYALKV